MTVKSKNLILNSEYSPFDEMKKDIYGSFRVGTFCRVLSFDSSRGTVELQPLIKERIVKEDNIVEVDMPIIKNIPVFFPGGVVFTPQVNDLALLIHVDRSINEVLINYDSTNPDTITPYGQGNSKRKHNLNDGVALVGFLSYKQADGVVFP